MELVLEIVGAQQFVPTTSGRRRFLRAGGSLGRAEDCDWVIPDLQRHLSNRHARVSYRDGRYFLTDTSSNGIRLKDSGAHLPKGEAHPIENGTVFCMGSFDIQARLVATQDIPLEDIGRPTPAGSIIPDDSFLELDPLASLDQEEEADRDDLHGLRQAPAEPLRQPHDHAPIERDSLPLPELVPPTEPPAAPVAAAEVPSSFWERLGDALGVDLTRLDAAEREALALEAAHLLRQCVQGLQQSLRTRAEIKNELRLPLTSVQNTDLGPLRTPLDGRDSLGALLAPVQTGAPTARLAVARAFRDLQAHQVALLSASRAAVRATLDHFAPEPLALRLERDGRLSRLSGAGGRWRAYQRYHQRLRHDDDWTERLLARDFAQAYEEQVRLIATLHGNPRE